MALTAEVKDELARIEVVKKSLRNAELATILRFAGGLHLVSGRIVVEAELDNSQIARRVSKDLAELYGIKSELSVMSAGGIRKGSRYIIRVTEQGEVLARQTGLLDTRGRPVRTSNSHQSQSVAATGTCGAKSVQASHPDIPHTAQTRA